MFIVQSVNALQDKFAFKDWLEQQFLGWQRERRQRETLTAFAEYLNVSENTLKKWIGGTRKPTGVSVDRLADKLGDEVYDILNVPRPDITVRALSRIVAALTDEQKQVLLHQAEKMIKNREGKKNDEPKARPAG